MIIALIVAGVVMGALGSNIIFMAGQNYVFWQNKRPDLVRDQWLWCVLGLIFVAAACACFYIAGTMAGAQ